MYNRGCCRPSDIGSFRMDKKADVWGRVKPLFKHIMHPYIQIYIVLEISMFFYCLLVFNRRSWLLTFICSVILYPLEPWLLGLIV